MIKTKVLIIYISVSQMLYTVAFVDCIGFVLNAIFK